MESLVIKKSGYGGKRAGAGRKPKAVTQPLKDISADVLKTVDARAIWIKLLQCDELRIVQDTIKYLTDRVYGKPTQALQVSGGTEPIKVIHEFIGR